MHFSHFRLSSNHPLPLLYLSNNPLSMLPLIYQVATIPHHDYCGFWGLLPLNDVALSSEVCFHPHSLLTVNVVVCHGFWGLLPLQRHCSLVGGVHSSTFTAHSECDCLPWVLGTVTLSNFHIYILHPSSLSFLHLQH